MNKLRPWSEFANVPPEIGKQLAYKPALISDDGYAKDHPELEAFFSTHPDLTDKLTPGRRFYELDDDTKRIAAERTVELEKRLDIMIGVWTDFKQIPEFDGAKSEDMPAIVEAKSLQIRDDSDDMRGFYRRHRNRSYPPAKLINEEWTFFRWIQVQLLAGLDFFASHGLGAPFNRENLFHGLLDLDYLITAIVVGGLASREKQMLKRFNLLRPDGLVLK